MGQGDLYHLTELLTAGMILAKIGSVTVEVMAVGIDFIFYSIAQSI